MARIIDIPFGTYLAYVMEYKDTEKHLDLTLEIAYGEWRGYFGVKDKVLSLKIPSGAFRQDVKYACPVRDEIIKSLGDNRTVVAIIISETRLGDINKYHNITDVVDWRTCETLSPEAREWAEQHYDDDVYDDTPLAYDMLPYALEYAKSGIKVFPLSPCNKVPLKDTNGFHDATNDIDKVKQWWTDNPFYNIGMATGNGISVIDVDMGTGDDGVEKVGEQSIKKWQEDNGLLPDTLTAITGKGGRHLYYKTEKIFGSATGVIKDIDVRSEGGYVVLPPSIHENGNRYRFVGDFDVSKITPADDVVNKFLSLAGSGKKGNKNSNAKNVLPKGKIIDKLCFDEGSRNDSLYRYGCSLQGKGYDDLKISAELTSVNLSKCNPPLSAEEVNKIYNSVISQPKGNKQNEEEIELADYTQYPYVDVKKSSNGDVRLIINPQKLAAYIRENNHYFFIESVGEKPVPYWYENGFYKQCNDLYFLGQIKRYIEIIDEELVEPSILNKVYRLLQTDLDNTVPANQLNSDSNIINFQNGLLHLDSMELTPHSPNIFSTIQLPCDWNPSPTSSPIFDNFISTLSSNNEEMKKLLTEYIGYAVSNVPGYLTKKALFLYGPGNTGKSQYLALLEKLVGGDNYCSITLQALEMRFGTAALFGKRVAGAADMGSASIRELEKFKSITGGDIIDFEFKGKDKFNARYNGLLVFCCNELPHFSGDRGDHVYERMILCKCENVIPVEKRDRHLLEKIYKEKEAIIYKGVMALKELLERGGGFTEPKEVQENRESYKTENDTVRQFLIECTDLCQSEPNTPLAEQLPLIKTADMLTYYIEWCKSNNYPYTNRLGFRKAVSNYFGKPIDELETVNSGIRYYKFRLKTKNIYNKFTLPNRYFNCIVK
ncbi:MAG: phage/plasmid primase, P4 family [Oscillospiraceae bacterium]|nr:phage/plasmid primase, P4 family [Oscillospiraceae bacterium]